MIHESFPALLSSCTADQTQVNMDLECILCTANSSYAVITPKDEVPYNTYWNFYKILKIWTCFLQNERFQDQKGGQETMDSCSKRGVGTYGYRASKIAWQTSDREL